MRPNEPLAILLEIYYEEDVDLDKDNLFIKSNKVITEAIKKHYLYNTEFKKYKEALIDESKPEHLKAMTWFNRLKEYFPIQSG